MAESFYTRARRAKAHIHEVNRLGWPDTADGIRSLVSGMEPDEETVCRCGRFVRRWDGWRFQFPSTVKVIEALRGNVEAGELLFVEDEEG